MFKKYFTGIAEIESAHHDFSSAPLGRCSRMKSRPFIAVDDFSLVHDPISQAKKVKKMLVENENFMKKLRNWRSNFVNTKCLQVPFFISINSLVALSLTFLIFFLYICLFS